jgi:hypothetical protein
MTHIWINLWSTEWQNSIKTASHQLQQYLSVRTTEYMDHLIKEAIEIWVNMENVNIDGCFTLNLACSVANMLCSHKSRTRQNEHLTRSHQLASGYELWFRSQLCTEYIWLLYTTQLLHRDMVHLDSEPHQMLEYIQSQLEEPNLQLLRI